ncbi:MAG: hypothetical protein AB7I41_01535 [Candidatus Sericytochromatia bacterium]
MRYHLVIQTPHGDLSAFFAQFIDRGLQAEGLSQPNSVIWSGFLDWQVSCSELQNWFKSHPDSGLWLVLDPDHLLLGHPQSGPPATSGLVELQSLSELSQILAAALQLSPAALLKQAMALMPTQVGPLSQALREHLPLFLSALGLPEILGSEAIPPPPPRFEWGDPALQIRALAGKLTLHTLDPPIPLATESAPMYLFLLAWLGAERVAPLLSFNFADCPNPPAPLEWPQIASSHLTQDPHHPQAYTLHLDADATPFGSWRDFADAWAYLWPQLPQGTDLELWLAPLAYDSEEQANPNPAGIQRYACTLQKTGLICWAAAPASDSERLSQALDLAAWVLNGGTYQLNSAEALTALCADAADEDLIPQEDYFIRPERQFEVPEGAPRAFLARRLFLRQFDDCWDLRQSQALRAEIAAEEEAFKAVFSHWGPQLKGDVLYYQGQSGNFWSGQATGLNALRLRQLTEATAGWERLGFQTLADLVWEPASDVYLRLLLANSFQGLALLMSGPLQFESEIVSWFADGARGVSSSLNDLPDFSAHRVYYYHWPEGPLSERIAAHWQQAEAYSAHQACPFLLLPARLSEILPLIDQNLVLVRTAQRHF